MGMTRAESRRESRERDHAKLVREGVRYFVDPKAAERLAMKQAIVGKE